MTESPVGPADIPPLPRPPYRNRRGWLIAFGIVEILIACFFLFMALLMAVLIPNIPKQPGQPPVPNALFYIVAFFYVMIAAVFATGGIGSMRAKNWARIFMIVLSSLWLAFGVFGTVISAVMIPITMRLQESVLRQNPPAQDAQLPSNFMGIVMVISLVFQIITLILLPLVFLLFYTRKNVKATCHAHSASTAAHYAQTSLAPAVSMTSAISGAPVASAPDKGLPVPIVVVIVWFAFIGVSSLFALWIPLTLFFGVILHGMAARLVIVTFGAVNVYCAWSFYKLRIEGWWVAISFFIFSLLSGIVTVVRVDLASFYEEIYRQMGMNSQQASMAMSFAVQPRLMYISMALGALIWGAFLVLLVYTKRYFRKDQASH